MLPGRSVHHPAAVSAGSYDEGRLMLLARPAAGWIVSRARADAAAAAATD